MATAISWLIPATFPALALAHLVALLSPGPDFFLVVGHAVRRRVRGTVYLCAGIAAGNAVYIIFAVAGWAAIRQSASLYRWLELAGAVYLIWMGCMLFRSGRQAKPLNLQRQQEVLGGRQFLTGLGSALLNPKNAIFYLTLMTVIIGPEATLVQQTFAGTWMVLLVFTWDLALAGIVSHPNAQRILASKIPLIEISAGIILISFAILLVFIPLGQ